MEIKKNLRMVLGTVQLGLDYGVNNFLGKPTREKSLEILDFAFNNGIRIFDTAAAYGDAEEILGEFIKKRGIEKDVFIISKLLPNIFSNEESEEEVKKIIESEVRKSLNRLCISKLYGYLLHTPEYIYNDKIVSALKYCKKIGLIENFGVSVYEEKDALYAASLPCDFIQIPYSVFDQRLNNTDFFELCKKNRTKVFARGAFLQGLIVMNEEKIPEHLNEAKEYLRDFDKIIKKYGVSRLEASLLFSYNNPYIGHVVFGVDNISQLREDLEIVERNKFPEGCRNQLMNIFMNIKKSIIFPSLWKKKEK
jgi:aryl-alcohol dehydrogenase-like predicted oxidoreductase